MKVSFECFRNTFNIICRNKKPIYNAIYFPTRLNLCQIEVFNVEKAILYNKKHMEDSCRKK